MGFIWSARQVIAMNGIQAPWIGRGEDEELPEEDTYNDRSFGWDEE